jgi:pyruvate carboxylase subunit B
MRLVVKSPAGDEEVEVERRSDAFEVRVGDRPYRVDAVAVGAGRRSLVIDGRQFEVGVRRTGDGAYAVSAASAEVGVEVADPLTHLAAKSRGSAARQGRRQVKAYMPGRVVAVLAQEGSRVEAGEGVVVLEAMKMENEIRAEQGGTVTRLHVQPGQAVEAGDPLFEIE